MILEAYSEQCNEAAMIFAEYQKRLQHFVIQVREAQTSSVADKRTDSSVVRDRDSVYSTLKVNRSADDVVLIETSWERDIRKGCELLASHMMERINSVFPAYQGSGIHPNPEVEAAKIGFEIDGDIPEEVKDLICNSLKNPPLLLQAITTYTSRMKALIHKETEKIDTKADAELLRWFSSNQWFIVVVLFFQSCSLLLLVYIYLFILFIFIFSLFADPCLI